MAQIGASVKITVFDDGHEHRQYDRNKYTVLESLHGGGKLKLRSSTGDVFTISAWKVMTVRQIYQEVDHKSEVTLDQLSPGMIVRKVGQGSGCSAGQTVGAVGVIQRLAPAEIWNGNSFPDGVWVNFPNGFHKGLAGCSLRVALSDLEIA